MGLLLVLCLNAAPLPSEDGAVYMRMSLTDLRSEARRLDDQRPSLVAPIFMLTSGGVMLGAGGWFGLFALGGLFGGPTLGNGMVILGLLLGGGGFLTGGLVFLKQIRAERADIDTQIDAIDEEIEYRKRNTYGQRMQGLTVVQF
jgi:hypothetical protein